MSLLLFIISPLCSLYIPVLDFLTVSKTVASHCSRVSEAPYRDKEVRLRFTYTFCINIRIFITTCIRNRINTFIHF
ncbi:hypothetical protein GGU10DRAFT_350320, partial [Lentinula aff. detonsa]